MKLCSRCEELLPLESFHRCKSKADGRQTTCKTCKTLDAHVRRQADLGGYAEKQAAWRAQNADAVRRIKARSAAKQRANPEERKKKNARDLLSWYVRNGKIAKPEVCSCCGETGVIQGHHHNYSKPLEVEWLCKRCHLSRHGKKERMIDPGGIHDTPSVELLAKDAAGISA